MTGLQDAEGFVFSTSEMLGQRAALVYQWFQQALDQPGDVAECGVYEGVTAENFARFLTARQIAKTVHLFDTFSGLPETITSEEYALSTWSDLAPGHYAASESTVRARLEGLQNTELHPGDFRTSFPSFDRALCFIHGDCDLYEGTCDIIALADRLLTPGGILVIDDYGNPRLPGVKLAVDRVLDPAGYDGERSPGTIQFVATKRALP